MDKKTLRKVYLEKRKLLSSSEYEQRNQRICERVIDLVQQKDFKYIHVFFSIRKFKEVDLSFFTKWCHANSSIQLVGSVTNLKEATMDHFLIEEGTTFEINKWGIPEPVGARPFNITQLDCVLVPMVIGSKTGQRIGYGKGYYDQFLAQCTSTTTFVGLNLSPLLEGTIYAEPHDIVMDYMITPFQLLKTFVP